MNALLRALDARCNPILVKELRQALHGRYFTVMFWLTVSVATTVGCLFLVIFENHPSDESGPVFFLAIYACLTAAVHAFVPFGAFLSVGGEWEENTYDLLILSNLRPGQIVVGKWLSALIQLGLFFCAFGPFLIFAFLLRGLDLSGALLWLGFTALTSTSVTALALALSSLSRAKFVRMFLMVSLAVTLVGFATTMFGVSVQVLNQRLFQEPGFQQVMIGFSIATVFLGGVCAAFAATRFSHPEENRSTPLRLLVSGLTLAVVLWLGWAYERSRQLEFLYVPALVAGLVLTLLCVSFVTEEERLGRRVRLQVPRNPLLALLSAPFQPGGGRGVLFLLLHLGLLVLAAVGLHRVFPPLSASKVQEGICMTASIQCYALVWLLLPSALLAPMTRDLAWRVVARLFVFLFAVGTFVVPTLVGFLLGFQDLAEGQHIGNPVVVTQAIERGGGPVRQFWMLVAVAGLALVINLPRLVRGVLEVLAASRQAAASRDPEPLAASAVRPEPEV